MRTEPTVQRLRENGVLATDSTGDVSGLTEQFQEAEASFATRLQTHHETGPVPLLSERFDDDLAAMLRDVATDAPEFVATYVALDDHVSGLSHEERVQSTVALEQLRTPGPREDGAPQGFVPIHGEHLPAIAALYPAAIVYIWREDCPPCDQVRKDLESLNDVASERVARFAVFGPNASRFLRSEYDVVGGPTTLFFEDGEVAARLQGAAHPDALERELQLVDNAVT